jgi:uncharacterized protein (DUF362 family)
MLRTNEVEFMENIVYVKDKVSYDVEEIKEYLNKLPVFELSIFKGNTVVIKPNWVRETHLENNSWEQVITNSCVIEAIIEITARRLQGEGKIIVTDGPQGDSDFSKILEHMNVESWLSIAAQYHIKLEILDLRYEQEIKSNGIIIDTQELPGDPKGSVTINLTGDSSEFMEHKKSQRGYFGATPNIDEVNKAHDGYNNLYSVAKTVVDADVIINVPKLKTHKKGGITCNLKNLVGINTNKNYLPHHSEGTPSEGGDQFANDSIKGKIEGNTMYRIKKAIDGNMFFSKIFIPVKQLGKLIFGKTSSVIRSGNWYGNDTLWRMVLDINKVLMYANSDNTLREDKLANRKRYISIVDGIIGGEGEGPLSPNPVRSGLIIVGTNPVPVDCCCAKLMGFDYTKIPSLKNSFSIRKYPLFKGEYDGIRIISDNDKYNKLLKDIDKKDVLNFEPHFGWKNHIELCD